ncbi:hypothetical protein MSG28_000928 [Choristoneura fumiferana]|uniref:Uncharacterized protein n=1 Tax=Choristoneura fumiferana TaxID=7141 RepID=A0ACC0K3M0_CHOFU|nr:hypothetical protein MSG28_000928 [Choristoneura fumiferana]
MDASVSPRVDSDINDVFFLKIEDSAYPEKKRTVIKYTKLPDFDYDSKVSWPKHGSYTLQPRLRRIIELDDAQQQTTRSLKTSTMAQSKTNSTTHAKRKTVTICENDDNSLTQNQDARDSKQSAKSNNLQTKRDNSVPKLSLSGKSSPNNRSLPDNTRTRSIREREAPRFTHNSSKINTSKNISNPSVSDKEISMLNKKNLEEVKYTTPKQPSEKNRATRTAPQSRTKIELLKDIKSNTRPITVIHVPLDNQFNNKKIELEETTSESDIYHTDVRANVDGSTDMGTDVHPTDANVGTTPLPMLVNQATETLNSQLNDICHLQDSAIQTEQVKEIFDKLDIPNVTLTKDKNNYLKEDLVTFCSHSLPNLQTSMTPSFKISPEEENNVNHHGFINSKSFIIGRATVTYTTKQKINFHVVGSSDDGLSHQSSSPLGYPLNVVSVFKKKLNDCESSEEDNFRGKKEKPIGLRSNLCELQALDCSYIFKNTKLVKPSDLISTISVNSGLLQNNYICEQFQRELHFIDSFFESLQYLESCSLSEKCFPLEKPDTWIRKTGLDFKNSEYNSLLSKIENGANTLAHVDDIETMASKSLCLLNLLIRDEQRRAKNLLFVLKMREDALKDFTKSQIIWLENKKKQENTDVSTLKKKQRGALLKLQHECGEMQRMRKALLTLSEKRKAALMKTRNNIELKLKNNVDVDQILLGKKKLKRNTAADRNVAPLKCFDLSSSGCDESVSPKQKPEKLQDIPHKTSSAEKCIQTGDSILDTPVYVDQMTDTAAENFVAVDGSYLNILFQSLSLPQIFSSGKQYEVNEEALRNIVNSSNNSHHKNLCDDFVENFMDKIKSRESDRSTSPSTAHSLVDEYDQYYKGLSDGGKSPIDLPDVEYHNQSSVFEIKDSYVQASDIKQDHYDRGSGQSAGTMTSGSAETVLNRYDFEQGCACEVLSISVETQSVKGRDVTEVLNQAGPLPVPPGAAASPEPPSSDGPESSSTSSESHSSSSAALCPSVSSLSTLAPGHNEAEELRRQQLAIEREIKALEQQQCQLLAVREIPDKPPPPYTPPHSQLNKPPRTFLMDEAVEQKIIKHVTHGELLTVDPNDPFEVFIKDICDESLKRQRLELSDDPWDACNLLPHKQKASPEKTAIKTIGDVKDLLSGVPPTVVSGVGARRSDHIDDILFAEWRRCEPEWTALHAEEATVKKQVFESIFQTVLNETIDRYKITVLGLIDYKHNPVQKPSRKKEKEYKNT